MNKEEFLMARIKEMRNKLMEMDEYPLLIPAIRGMEAAITLHGEWPMVLEERLPQLEQRYDEECDAITYTLTKRVEWMTRGAYRKTFGDEPPTSSIVHTMLMQYTDHPDFQEEWLG